MYSLMTHDRICQHCGKEFVSQKKSTKYRRENEELKASVDRLCNDNAQLKDEIRQLKEKML